MDKFFEIHDAICNRIPDISIVDVGAMEIEKPVYAPLMDLGVASIIGFEPVVVECEKLNHKYGAQGHTFLPYVIGDGSQRQFHECNFPMTSSLYTPNTDLLAKFQNLEELVRVVESTSVMTRRLDDIDEIASIDYLKIDVQGAELDVFKGGKEKLKSALVIHTEVEFVPLYKNQPLFSDVDIWLRQEGFLMHRFYGISGRTFKPLMVNNNPNQALSQALWSDVIYVRDFMSFDSMNQDELLKLALILSVCYQSHDLASLALQSYSNIAGEDLYNSYLKHALNF